MLLTFSARAGHLRSALLHPLGGGLGEFIGLVPFLARRGSVHGIRAVGLEKGEEPDAKIDDMVRRYAAMIRQLPALPNLLMGWSLGGILAWELAVLLTRDGPPPDVVLIDSSPEPWVQPRDAEIELRSEIVRRAAETQGGQCREAVERTVDAHINARRGYRVTTHYAGRVLLVPCVTGGEAAQIEGWSALARDITVRPIRCSHFEVFARGNLPVLSGFIGEFLAG